MAHPDSSLSLLKLIPGDPEVCALRSCDNTVPKLPCNGCCNAPALDLSGDRLKDVRYCCESHREQDTDAHKEICRNRRWLRDGERVAELHHAIFACSCEEIYDRVLTRVEEASDGCGIQKLFFLPCSSPAAVQPFCSQHINVHIKTVALCLNACVHATQVGAPLIAYMTQGRNFRNSIIHGDVKSKREVQAWWEEGAQIKVEGYMHSIVRLSPSFLPAMKTTPWAQDGLISDPSADQLYYIDEYCTRADDYWNKAKLSTTSVTYPTNVFLELLHRDIQKPENVKERWDRSRWLEQNATLRVIDNALFAALEGLGGADYLLSIPYCYFEQAMSEIQLEVRSKLRELRGQLDHINHVLDADEDEKLRLKGELAEQSNGEGNREMMELLWEESIN